MGRCKVNCLANRCGRCAMRGQYGGDGTAGRGKGEEQMLASSAGMPKVSG